jgi:hypothetical protein
MFISIDIFLRSPSSLLLFFLPFLLMVLELLVRLGRDSNTLESVG